MKLPFGNMLRHKYILHLTDRAYMTLEGFRRGNKYALTLYDADAVRKAERDVKVWTNTVTTRYKGDLPQAKLSALELVREAAHHVDAQLVNVYSDAVRVHDPDFWKELFLATEIMTSIEAMACKEEKSRWIGV